MPATIGAISQHGDFHPTDYIIPQMTAVFVDCFTMDSKGCSPSVPSNPGFPKVMRSAAMPVSSRMIRTSDQAAIPASDIAKAERNQYQVPVRTLVQFISHHFNNILMGIWGNVSLVRLGLAPQHRMHGLIEQAENLIQDGAFFIHLILGYLAERRVTAKRLRLNQLVNEITLHVPDSLVRAELVRQLQINAALRRSKAIAASTALILDHLMHGIDTLAHEIAVGLGDQPRICERIAKIDELMAKGHELTTVLHYYGGRAARKMRHLNAQRLVERLCRRVAANHPDIRLKQLKDASDSTINGDRAQIEWMIAQMLENTCRTITAGGEMIVGIRQNNPEPSDILVSGGGVTDCLEIRIMRTPQADDASSGKRKSFKKISDVREPEMRLAAVQSLAKQHGGFICGDWNNHCGDVRIYLPQSGLKQSQASPQKEEQDLLALV